MKIKDSSRRKLSRSDDKVYRIIFSTLIHWIEQRAHTTVSPSDESTHFPSNLRISSSHFNGKIFPALKFSAYFDCCKDSTTLCKILNSAPVSSIFLNIFLHHKNLYNTHFKEKPFYFDPESQRTSDFESDLDLDDMLFDEENDLFSVDEACARLTSCKK